MGKKERLGRDLCKTPLREKIDRDALSERSEFVALFFIVWVVLPNL